MIHHFVQFSLRLEGSWQEKQAHLAQIKQSLEHLPQEIEALEDMKVTINQNPDEKDGFMLEAVCPTWQALADYAIHPSHVAVVQRWIAPYKEGRSCVDIER